MSVDRYDGHFKRELYGAFVKHEDYISLVRELEAERDRYKSGVRCPHCDELRLDIGELRARHAALVEAARHGLSLLYELGSPHCNTELALKDIAMVTEELKAALAEVKG